MKKPIEAKRVAVVVCILTIVLFTFPASSFGWDGCVIRNQGDILGLVFDFGEGGLPLELPGLGSVDVTYAVVEGSGREKSFITPFDQYIYQTKLVDGWGDLKKGRIIAYLKGGDDFLVFKFNKVRLFESFFMNSDAALAACQEGIEPDEPDNVDIYFEAKRARLVGLPGVRFNILLKIDGGEPDIIIEEIP